MYQREKGTSFDGDNIYAYIYTHFDNAKSIEINKGYEGPVTIEGSGTGYAEIDVSYQLDYARAEVGQSNVQTAELPLDAASAWDDVLLWDTGVVWDDSSSFPVLKLDLTGEGRNISWIITKDSDYFVPVLLTGVHYRYFNRSVIRG
ncbi:MAG: hypothetical protein E4H01_00515 [Lysobacterales bacterium]|nr:MAG: hypothetical protein E4H01_00515 [Xanthomonadales bacterium]